MGVPFTFLVNTHSQPHPINPPYQPTLSTHPINSPYQPTLSTHPINSPYQPTDHSMAAAMAVAAAALSAGAENTNIPQSQFVEEGQLSPRTKYLSRYLEVSRIVVLFLALCKTILTHPLNIPLLYNTPSMLDIDIHPPHLLQLTIHNIRLTISPKFLQNFSKTTNRPIPQTRPCPSLFERV